MKCPFCNTEMKQGWLTSKGRILWSQKENKISIIKGKNDIYPQGSTFFEPKIPTYCCEKCKKMILDY